MIGLVHITATPPNTFLGNYRWFTEVHPEYAPHDLFSPKTLEFANFVPYDQPSKALVNKPGGVETNNRAGGLYQVEIVAEHACGDYPDEWYANLRAFLIDKGKALGIEPVWYRSSARLTFAEWDGPLSGWYRHPNVPENDHPCSELLDLDRLNFEEDMTKEEFAAAIGAEVSPAGVIVVELLNDDGTLGKYPLAAAISYAHREAKLAKQRAGGTGSPSAVADEIARRLSA